MTFACIALKPQWSPHTQKKRFCDWFFKQGIDIFSLIAFNIQEITMSNSLPSHSGRLSECFATKGKLLFWLYWMLPLLFDVILEIICLGQKRSVVLSRSEKWQFCIVWKPSPALYYFVKVCIMTLKVHIQVDRANTFAKIL